MVPRGGCCQHNPVMRGWGRGRQTHEPVVELPLPGPRTIGSERKRQRVGREGRERAQRMLRAGLGPRVGSKASTHLAPRCGTRSLTPSVGSPSRCRGLPPLPLSPPPSPPLTAPAADLSAPLPAPLPALAAFPAACTSLLYSGEDGGGGGGVWGEAVPPTLQPLTWARGRGGGVF